MDQDDPFWKLRPLGPTPSDELCACRDEPALVLVGSVVSHNPLRCIACNGEVPPESIGVPEGMAEALAQDLADWNRFYGAFDTLWLDSAEYEMFAVGELSNAHSPLHIRGKEVARQLSAFRRAYRCWFQEPGQDDFVPLSACPECASALSRSGRALVCNDCLLAVFN